VSETDALPLQWRIEPTPEAAILRTTGDVDLSTRSEFFDAVQAAKDTTTAVIVVDLGQVTFISSTGMQLLLDLHHEAEQSNRTLRVAYGAGNARRAFKIAGIDYILSVYDTVEDALAAGRV
jgi:anti-anti-sigma factor